MIPVIFIFAGHVQLCAQVMLDFEQGLSDTLPVSAPGRWGIDEVSPISGNGSLHHIFDNREGSHDQIAFPVTGLAPESGLVRWSFKVRYEHTPSSLNNWSFFLMADCGPEQMHPGGKARGFVLGVNYLGSDDLLKLYKTDGKTTEVILNTGYNWQDSSLLSREVGIQAERSSGGTWKVRLETESGSSTEIGSAFCSELFPVSCCGLYYKYSSTKDRMLWFDDLMIDGTFRKDTLPPEILSLVPDRLNRLRVLFNEAVDSAGACHPGNYRLEPQDMAPDSVKFLNTTEVMLFFPEPFRNEKEHRLTASNMEDLQGNRSPGTIAAFFWFLPGAGDVVITEFMADPVPQVQLPALEYIELMNTSATTICLKKFRMYSNSNYTEIPEFTLGPGEYLLLVPDEWDSSVHGAGNMLQLNPFPSLRNTGQILAVTDSAGLVLDVLRYGKNWFTDPLRNSGGWSLERIDPENLSGDPRNWSYSLDPSGGTPGESNSVQGFFPDLTAPSVLKIYAEGDCLYLVFTERIPENTLYDAHMYTISESIEGVPVAGYDYPLQDRVCLQLSASPDTAIVYSLELAQGFTDYEGNALTTSGFQFSNSAGADSADLLITEIMYEPNTGKPEFIEFLNASDGVLDLRDYRLAVTTSGSDPEEGRVLVRDQYQVLPGSLCVLTEDTVLLKKEYPQCPTRQMILSLTFPALRNEGGSVLLMHRNLRILEQADYQPGMHHPLFTETRGISLERVSLQARGTDYFNWNSSSAVAGASPGSYTLREDSIPSQPEVYLSPVVFSPDNDGYQDLLELGFSGEPAGSIFNLRVYDLTGKYLCMPYHNERIIPDKSYFWNGTNGNTLVCPGTYILFIEVLRPDGDILVHKKAIHLTLNRRR